MCLWCTSMCVGMFECVCICVLGCAYGGPRLKLDVFFNHSPGYMLKQGLSLNLGLLFGLSGQFIPEIQSWPPMLLHVAQHVALGIQIFWSSFLPGKLFKARCAISPACVVT